MIDHLPPSMRGLMMAGFLAAYMSTVATHLNWGASYMVGDLYKRFIRPDESERHYVRASRIATLLTMVISGVITLYLESISGAWKVLLALGSGTGLVLILRWYWWRINAWSEIAAMAASFVGSLSLRYGAHLDPEQPRPFAYLMLGTLAITTVAWLVATYVTQPEADETLIAFYRRVRPVGAGWTGIARKSLAADGRELAPAGPGVWVRLIDWVLGCALIYCSLFGVGFLLVRGDVVRGAALLVGALACGALLARDLSRDDALSGS
jgi:hypothetical protein